ncbi:hypothetical protein D3C86_2211780 [compost metagenome]
MERTMTSNALGNSFRNFFCRREIRKPTNQRGRPMAMTKPTPATATSGRPRMKAKAASTRPKMTLKT